MKMIAKVLVLFLTLIVGSSVALAQNGLIPEFDAEFSREVTENKIPGAAYAIIRDGGVVAMRVHGTRAADAELPVTSNTVFRLASVSKTFAADLAAILQAENKIDLSQPVTRYVPGLKFKKAGHAGKVTLAHLLSHSTGITPNAYDNMLEEGWPLDKIIPRFNRIDPMCAPGQCYGYQNILYSLIKPAIEQSTGEAYEDLVRERLLEPLGMKDASLGLEAYLSEANRAAPHVFTKRDGWTRVLVDRNYYNVTPAAGVNASIEDLTKWVLAQMGENGAVLSADVLAAVTQKRVATTRELRRRGWRGHLTKAHYGYGWRIYRFGDHDVILHAGGVKGFRTFISYSRETGTGFAIMMNAQTRAIDRLSSYFWVKAFEDATQTAEAR